jgi:hypothetical protein
MADRTKLFALLTFVVFYLIFTQSATIPQPLKICSFNIQIFGEKKVNDHKVFDEIVKIVHEYDIIFIMEIRDSSNTAIFKLLAALNKDDANRYSVALGDRLGRSNSKEQYAYIYKNSLVKVVAKYTFDDSHADIFEREPYVVRFSAPSAAVTDFFMIGIHATPDKIQTNKEIASLIDVYEDARRKFQIDDAIIMGDMNADCGYMSALNRKNNALIKDLRFVWLIGDNADTTTKSTNCAYDRVIVAGKNMIAHVGKAEPYDFQKHDKLDSALTQKVSDHYPIIFTIQ